MYTTAGSNRHLLLLLLLIATCGRAVIGVMDDTYYKELDVPTDASHTEIKKAYRMLALRWHPDKNQAADKASAEAKFVRLANAYQVLSNAALRRVYDVNGLGQSRASTGGNTGSGGGSGFQTYQFRSAEQIFNDVFGEDNLFADFFDEDINGNGGADDAATAGDATRAAHTRSVLHGYTETTKTRTITRTSTVDGQQRSISRTHSTTDRNGVTVTRRAGERLTGDGRQVKTAEIEESRPDGQRRYERRQIVDGKVKHYDARLDPDKEILHPDL